tara:strand:+ start:871 stop:1323 length:453 start_codon:yes stop_codon:yes gene_type:complete
MKFLATIALLALSLTASAESCFTRTTTIQNTEVSLANTLCFAEPELELNYFEDSYVLLRYSIDGQRAFKKAKVKGKFDNNEMFVVQVGIENNSEGGFCDRYFEASSSVTIKIKKDGSKASIDSMKGEIYYTYDQCHDQPDLIQTVDYTKN